MAIAELDRIVRGGLADFADEIRNRDWTGRREREAVSYFAFRHLVPQCTQGSVLYDPAQISVEVAVPQLDRKTITGLTKKPTAKSQVCKDLVLWPKPGMTCWNAAGQPAVHPMSILEWKFGGRTLFEYDMLWLQAYSSHRAGFVGYAIQADSQERDFTVAAARVRRGVIDRDWLRV